MERTVFGQASYRGDYGRGYSEMTLLIIDTFGKVSEISLNRLGKDRIFFGRDPRSNDIVIPSETISGNHGKFKIDGNRLLYADLNSTNGTILEMDGYRRMVRGNSRYEELRSGTMLRIQPKDYNADNSVMLLYMQGKTEGSWNRFPLLASKITIGRSDESDIVLPSPSVSRHHAEISRSGKGFVIRDLDSFNGILINGKKLNGSVLLREKDVIWISNHTLIFTNGMIFYKNSAQGINIEVSHINKYVGRDRKQILHDVSCTIESNEFVAIIGGSGAGKTTLMNAISSYDANFSGEILFNGIDVKSHFNMLKSLIGYVPQEDIIYDNLTLQKMLYYTAKLKMPGDTSEKEIRERIGQVLNMVELSQHKNTLIRKLSGGQKKRASIAVELLADPSVFFLDEPTSGLDPGTEQKLMMTLNKLSKARGKTIIMATHTTQSLQLCDKVIIMGQGGRLCFCGAPDKAKMFFDTDNLVDVYNMVTDDSEFWSAQFASCSQDSRGAHRSDRGSEKLTVDKKKGMSIAQLPVLVRRYLELIRNDSKRLMLLFAQPLAIALLLAVVANERTFYQYDDTKSILFALSCAGIWIGLFNSIQEICKERAILRREYMGRLKMPYYVVSKFFVQTLIGLAQAVLMMTLFYFIVGHPAEGVLTPVPWIEMTVTVWLTIEAAMAIGFVVSALAKNGDQAMTFAPFILIVQLLFSGILFELKGAGDKIAYFTISKWSVESLGGTAVLNDLPMKLQKNFPGAEHKAEEIFYSTSAHILTTWGIMIGMMFCCGVICTLLARRVAKDTR